MAKADKVRVRFRRDAHVDFGYADGVKRQSFAEGKTYELDENVARYVIGNGSAVVLSEKPAKGEKPAKREKPAKGEKPAEQTPPEEPVADANATSSDPQETGD